MAVDIRRHLSRARRFASRTVKSPRLFRILALAQFAIRPVMRNPDAANNLLVASPGAGNIGDQALLEAYLDQVGGVVVVIVRDTGSFTIPTRHQDRTSTVVMPGLLYGGFRAFLTDLLRYRVLLSSATSVSVIGADIMDGAYSPRASTRRSLVVELGNRSGIDSRVLGFSWNGKANRSAKKALASAGASGVRLLLRDPRSLARSNADALPGVTGAADIVFLLKSYMDTPVKVVGLDSERPFALVNVSGMISKSIDQTPGYTRVVKMLVATGLDVVLVPHVSRAGGDDIAACRLVHDAVGDPNVHLIDRLLAPSEIRNLCDRATLTVTGRMHLAIMSLMHSTPAITIETQGKVRGLMELFELEHLCVQATSTFDDEVVAVIEKVLPEILSEAEAIRQRLPTVMSLANRNFEGLPRNEK